MLKESYLTLKLSYPMLKKNYPTVNKNYQSVILCGYIIKTVGAFQKVKIY